VKIKSFGKKIHQTGIEKQAHNPDSPVNQKFYQPVSEIGKKNKFFT
jgi:hypothetical protein